MGLGVWTSTQAPPAGHSPQDLGGYSSALPAPPGRHSSPGALQRRLHRWKGTDSLFPHFTVGLHSSGAAQLETRDPGRENSPRGGHRRVQGRCSAQPRARGLPGMSLARLHAQGGGGGSRQTEAQAKHLSPIPLGPGFPGKGCAEQAGGGPARGPAQGAGGGCTAGSGVPVQPWPSAPRASSTPPAAGGRAAALCLLAGSGRATRTDQLCPWCLQSLPVPLWLPAAEGSRLRRVLRD